MFAFHSGQSTPEVRQGKRLNQNLCEVSFIGNNPHSNIHVSYLSTSRLPSFST